MTSTRKLIARLATTALLPSLLVTGNEAVRVTTFVLVPELTGINNGSFQCSERAASAFERGAEECLSVSCSDGTAFIGFSNSECIYSDGTEDSVLIRGGIFEKIDIDVATVEECMRKTLESSECLNTLQKYVPNLYAVAYLAELPLSQEKEEDTRQELVTKPYTVIQSISDLVSSRENSESDTVINGTDFATDPIEEETPAPVVVNSTDFGIGDIEDQWTVPTSSPSGEPEGANRTNRTKDEDTIIRAPEVVDTVPDGEQANHNSSGIDVETPAPSTSVPELKDDPANDTVAAVGPTPARTDRDSKEDYNTSHAKLIGSVCGLTSFAAILFAYLFVTHQKHQAENSESKGAAGATKGSETSSENSDDKIERALANPGFRRDLESWSPSPATPETPTADKVRNNNRLERMLAGARNLVSSKTLATKTSADTSSASGNNGLQPSEYSWAESDCTGTNFYCDNNVIGREEVSLGWSSAFEISENGEDAVDFGPDDGKDSSDYFPDDVWGY